MNEALEILEKLNSLDEDVRIDAKIGSKIDRSIMESICAFSNEPNLGGGMIILGVSAKDTDDENEVKSYEIVGVVNPDKLQSDIASICASSFNTSIRPFVSIDKVEGKNVIIINVSELDERSKPLFFKNEGLPRGAYRRIGPTDQRCTEDDMPLFYASTDSYDSAIVDDITYRQLSGLKNAKASRDLAKMSSYGLLCIKKHGSQTYYTAGNVLSLSTEVSSLSTEASSLSTEVSSLSTEISSLSTEVSSLSPMAESLSPEVDILPDDLRKKIESLGKRTSNREFMNEIVVELCRIKPRSIAELAKIIKRSDNYVKHDVVLPLRVAGKLDYTIPDMINHPEQKYKAK